MPASEALMARGGIRTTERRNMDIKSAEWKKVVKEGAAELSIEVSDSALEMLAVYGDELIKWNRITNLTAITEAREVAIKHFIDSLAPLKMVAPGMQMLDKIGRAHV